MLWWAISARICEIEINHKFHVHCDENCSYPLFKLDDLFVRHGIGLGNDGNQVNLGVEAAHELNVNLLQPGEESKKKWAEAEFESTDECPVGWMK